MRLQLGPVTVDLDARRVSRPGSPDAPLTPIEARLLQTLADANGRALSSEELLRRAWGYRTTATRTLATTVARLRKKIESRPESPTALITVTRVGYRLQTTQGPTEPSLREREPALHAVREGLIAGRWVTVVGPPGAGKSSVAAIVAEERGAARVIAGPDLPRAIAAAMAWPVAAPDVDAVVGLLLRAGPTTLWLDDVDGVRDQVASVGTALLARCPALVVLTSSRRPLRVPGELLVAVEGLSHAACRALLGEGDPAVLDAIADAVDRLPLPLGLLRPWIPLLGAPGVLDALGSGGSFGRLSGVPGEAELDLDAMIAPSLHALRDPERITLRALCAFAGPVGLDDLGALVPQASAALGALVDHHLVARHEDRFAPLACVRRVVRAEPSPFDAAHAERFAALGARPSIEAALARGDHSMIARLRRARPDLALAFGRALAAGRAETAAGCALAFAASCAWQGGWDEAFEMLSAALDAPASWRARVLVALATASRLTGRARWALPQIDEYVALARDPEPREAAELGLARSECLRALGDLTGAQATLAGVTASAPDGTEVQAAAWGALGEVASTRGEFDLAEMALRHAVELHGGRGDQRHLGRLLPRVAILEYHRRRACRPTLQRARAIAESLQATDLLAGVAAAHALLAAWSGDHTEAALRYAEAADRYRELGATESVLRMELDQSAIEINLGRLDLAWEAASRALPVLRARGDRQAEAQALYLLGEILFRRGDLQEALAYLEPARERAVQAVILEQVEERIRACRAVLGSPNDPDLPG